MTKDRENNIEKLNLFLELKDNWNDNNVKPFTSKLIEKVKLIISNVDYQPYIFPTACNSIQLEYEMENGNYLEFEIFENSIKVFQVINSIEKTFYISEDIISTYINNFYNG